MVFKEEWVVVADFQSLIGAEKQRRHYLSSRLHCYRHYSDAQTWCSVEGGIWVLVFLTCLFLIIVYYHILFFVCFEQCRF